MATITAELLPNSAAIRLSVDTLSGVESLTRRDANGINDVRTLPGVMGTIPPTKVGAVNYATNPVPGNVNGWLTSSGYVRSYDTTNRFGRTGSMLFTKSGGGAYVTYGRRAGLVGTGTASTVPSNFTDVVAVSPGETVFAQMDLATDTPNTTARITIRFFDASWSSVLSTTTTPVDLPVNTWLTFAHSGTAPAGAVGYWLEWGIELKTGETVGGERSWAGRVLLGPPGPYFAGDTTDTDTARYDWSGTAHGSTSTKSVIESPIIFTDYEAASGPVAYDLVNGAGELVTLDVAGFVLDAPWLFTPLIPGYSRKAVSVTGLDTEFGDMSTVHSGLLGRSDPVVVLRPLGLRSGTMDIYAGTYAAALEILSPLQRATVMMLRQPEHAGLDMYFAPAGGSPKIVSLVTNGGATVFGVQVPYIEVKRPEGPIAGALGWTYADLAAAVPRYSDLRRTFATYADMRLNKRITT
ncbi:minor tail protein [Arthrobacter phage Whytu]|uniref:Minor tail protein n=1 Tax=Arthrobacter phage Whytu TaxID=2713260 RepID=A0A6G8R3E7_9CAUD|nr:minor tail protein [Arthrobacter phage Whytu]QIN94478.1 minor tail protein [Arthrobacter phage Whytu]